MKRGDIVIVADPSAGDFAGKPRPAVIVQSDLFIDGHPSVTVCLITSQQTPFHLFRLPLPADDGTGLLKPSEVSIDKIQTVWTHRIGRLIGQVTRAQMFAIDEALRRWLAL